MKRIVNCSFGADSLAMTIKLVEGGLADEVVFYNTGMEFDSIYGTRDKLIPFLTSHGVKYTELEPSKPFLYSVFEEPHTSRVDGITRYGYGWCGGGCRWGTHEKILALDKYCEGHTQYIGICGNEWQRLLGIFEFDMEEYTNKKGELCKRALLDEKGCVINPKQVSRFNKIYPLIPFNERECREFCYSRGFYWEEEGVRLYDILDRVSCWCCANKNLKELKNYYLYLPKYWERLKEMQSKIDRPFKYGKYTIFDLEERFKREVQNGKM